MARRNASSPVAEVYFAEEPPAEAPTAAVVTDGSCFRQIEFVGILSGTQVEEEARLLVDFLLDRRFQEDIPLKMFVYPVNETAELPEVFQEHSRVPVAVAQMDPARIAANRETWIQAWTVTASGDMIGPRDNGSPLFKLSNTINRSIV